MSAFFTLPSYFEQKYVNITSLVQDYYDYSGHFVTVNQLFFSRFWGDGSSAFGEENDGMSFSLGHLHWSLSLMVGVFLVIMLTKKMRKIGMIRELKSDRL